jgi:hypothetical protein
MRLPKLIAALGTMALLGSAACVGELAPGPGTGNPGGGSPDAGPGTGGEDPDGEALFQQNILPMVAGCGAPGLCHTGEGTDPLKFLGVDSNQENFYSSIVNYAQVHGGWEMAQASMVIQLQLDAETVGNHYGYLPWTAEQEGLIQEWFSAEKIARAGDNGGGGGEPTNPGGPTNSRTLLAEWAGCMTLENWEASNMGRWRNKGTNNGACSNCHNEGQFWININPNSEIMFEMNRYELFITGFFAPKMNPDGTGEIVPAYDKLVRVGQGNTAGSLHPTYNTDIENDQYFQYLTEFYELTMALKDAGQCGPPGFPDPNAAP